MYHQCIFERYLIKFKPCLIDTLKQNQKYLKSRPNITSYILRKAESIKNTGKTKTVLSFSLSYWTFLPVQNYSKRKILENKEHEYHYM